MGRPLSGSASASHPRDGLFSVPQPVAWWPRQPMAAQGLRSPVLGRPITAAGRVSARVPNCENRDQDLAAWPWCPVCTLQMPVSISTLQLALGVQPSTPSPERQPWRGSLVPCTDGSLFKPAFPRVLENVSQTLKKKKMFETPTHQPRSHSREAPTRPRRRRWRSPRQGTGSHSSVPAAG